VVAAVVVVVVVVDVDVDVAVAATEPSFEVQGEAGGEGVPPYLVDGPARVPARVQRPGAEEAAALPSVPPSQAWTAAEVLLECAACEGRVAGCLYIGG